MRESALKILLLTIFAALSMLAAGAAVAAEPACGGETACEIDGGHYYIHMPGTPDRTGPLGAVFYLHGHRGKAVNAIRNKNFQKLADDLGVAFVAVQGIDGTWSFPTAPRNLRDEYSFFDRVLEDLSDRFGVDGTRTLLSGFSSGGFMTWYLACENAGRFAGYAPIAGAFWKPLPEDCPSEPPYLFHVHGTSDTVVPLAGRPLGGGRWHQGDVFKSFDVWLRQTGLASREPAAFAIGNLRCERWRPQGGLLELCLHDGGHDVRAAWLKRAWYELAKARGWDDVNARASVARCRETDNKVTDAKRTEVC
jgi:polyhydroxybutyrate depolymerase